MKVQLTSDEVTICHIIGRVKAEMSSAANYKDCMIAENGQKQKDNADAGFEGFMAELAFAKHFNLYPELKLLSGGADGVYKECRYDIKATPYTNGHLTCKKKDVSNVDIYIMAVVNVAEKMVDFKGYAGYYALRQDKYLRKEGGYEEAYWMPQDDLIKFKDDK